MYKTSEVFKPGGMPELTYIQRLGGELEAKLREIKEGSNKMVVLTGPTKSGKTVLVKRVFPPVPGGTVWIDGGSVRTEEDFWVGILQVLDEPIEVSSTTEQEVGGEVGVGGEGSTSIIVAGARAHADISLSYNRTGSRTQSAAGTPLQRALHALRRSRRAVVIDDFHYIDRDIQRNIVRSLKPLIFEGIPVVAIAIPHRGFDPIRVEREITGRLEHMKIPDWSQEELNSIPETGFPLLRVVVPPEMVRSMYAESNKSPHLMQDFCSSACQALGVKETLDVPITLMLAPEELYKQLSVGAGKVVYDELKRGPRQRGRERNRRKLKMGGDVDIYGAVLLALCHIKPGMETVEYSELSSALSALIVVEDLPGADDVSRVLGQMSKIASTQGASVAVLDWDRQNRILHITDPFFAFFLKWGGESALR